MSLNWPSTTAVALKAGAGFWTMATMLCASERGVASTVAVGIREQVLGRSRPALPNICIALARSLSLFACSRALLTARAA